MEGKYTMIINKTFYECHNCSESHSYETNKPHSTKCPNCGKEMKKWGQYDCDSTLADLNTSNLKEINNFQTESNNAKNPIEIEDDSDGAKIFSAYFYLIIGFVVFFAGIIYRHQWLGTISAMVLLLIGYSFSNKISPEMQKKMSDYEKAKMSNCSTIECPYCHSTNTKKITTTTKVVNTVAWGIFGTKRHKEWHCNKCKSDF